MEDNMEIKIFKKNYKDLFPFLIISVIAILAGFNFIIKGVFPLIFALLIILEILGIIFVLYNTMRKPVLVIKDGKLECITQNGTKIITLDSISHLNILKEIQKKNSLVVKFEIATNTDIELPPYYILKEDYLNLVDRIGKNSRMLDLDY